MTERNDPTGGSDDLFEDLDTFFSSMDQDDWPGPIEPESAKDHPTDQPPRAEDGPEAASPGEAPPEPPRVPDEPTGEAPATGGSGAQRGEMSTADWTRLRDVLGEEDDEDSEFGVAETRPPPATGGPLFGFPPPEEDEEPPSDLPAFWET